MGIKKIIKKWMIPPGYINLFNQLRSKKSKKEVMIENEILKKNGIFKDAGKGRRAFLLATGPSIKDSFSNIISEPLQKLIKLNYFVIRI